MCGEELLLHKRVCPKPGSIVAPDKYGIRLAHIAFPGCVHSTGALCRRTGRKRTAPTLTAALVLEVGPEADGEIAGRKDEPSAGRQINIHSGQCAPCPLRLHGDSERDATGPQLGTGLGVLPSKHRMVLAHRTFGVLGCEWGLLPSGCHENESH